MGSVPFLEGTVEVSDERSGEPDDNVCQEEGDSHPQSIGHLPDAGGPGPLVGREPGGGDLDGGGHEDGTSHPV